jgi:hypothetical protein
LDASPGLSKLTPQHIVSIHHTVWRISQHQSRTQGF